MRVVDHVSSPFVIICTELKGITNDTTSRKFRCGDIAVGERRLFVLYLSGVGPAGAGFEQFPSGNPGACIPTLYRCAHSHISARSGRRGRAHLERDGTAEYRESLY